MGQHLSAFKESEVGHGCYKAYKFTSRWKFSNFQNLPIKDRVGRRFCITTPSATVKVQDKTYSFNLILYPHGYNERVEEYISVFLKKNSTDEMLIQFTCAILDRSNKLINRKCIKRKMSLESHLGCMTYCKRDFLLDSETKVLIDGNLILDCTLEIFENKAIMNAETEDSDSCMCKWQSKVSDDLNCLHLEGDFSDFTFKVDGRTFPVHKAILSARSAVFNATLKSQLYANSKEINISDIKAETVKEMLHYIYSGDIGYIEIQTAQELYYAADKYELQGLKNKCSKILMHNLDTNNAIDVLLLGHVHSDSELEYTSIKFIAKNAQEIQEKKEWVVFMKNYPELANRVFKFLSEKP
ncbi:unnamed protein product [Larinioides sclopetarius]|uniref:Uncharacterized protein n=1 Tax=Larinioides sclopetarius TaxID=280406 RepID=A0AAV2A682_9ARAC